MSLGIVHFSPLEQFPPVMNMIKYLSSGGVRSISIYTTESNFELKTFDCVGVKIKRIKGFNSKDPHYLKLLTHVKFNLFNLFSLILSKTERVLYYETLSVGPVILYKMLRPKTKIFVHYHEYSSQEWYSKSTKVLRLYRYLETKFLLPNAEWISHTNSDRLDYFNQDLPFLKKDSLHPLPNLPLKSWSKSGSKRVNEDHISMVYAGSISLRDTHIKSIINWILKDDTKATLDLFCYNFDSETESYLLELSKLTKKIKFFSKGIDYYELSLTLSKYDVGLIIYNARNINFIYNAPNKLFEYLASGIDVWVPIEQSGSKKYFNDKAHPLVQVVNYNDHLDLSLALEKRNKVSSFRDVNYFLEENVEAKTLLRNLLN